MHTMVCKPDYGILEKTGQTGVSRLYLTSGKVHITGKNLHIGGTNETDISAGQCVQTYLYNYLEGEESIQFEEWNILPNDVPVFMMQKIAANKKVMEQTDYTGCK